MGRLLRAAGPTDEAAIDKAATAVDKIHKMNKTKTGERHPVSLVNPVDYSIRG
jgi:hypothetical protein